MKSRRTGNVLLHLSDFLKKILAKMGTYVYIKGNTRKHTQRKTDVMTIGKICKEDLPKICEAIDSIELMRQSMTDTATASELTDYLTVRDFSQLDYVPTSHYLM